MKRTLMAALVLIAGFATAQTSNNNEWPATAAPNPDDERALNERRPPTWDDMDLAQPTPPGDQFEGERPPGPPPDDRPGQPPGQPGQQPGVREPGFAVQRLMEVFREQNPQEFERLKKLKQDDPDAFVQELRQLLRRERERLGVHGEPGGGPRWQHGESGGRDQRGPPQGGGPGQDLGMNVRSPEIDRLEMKAHELARAYRLAKGDGEKAEMRDSLRSTLGEAFDLREQMRRERLQQMETRLGKVKQVLDQRQAHRDEIIDRHLKDLTEMDTMAW